MQNTCRCCLLNDENQILLDMIQNEILFESASEHSTFMEAYEKCSGLEKEEIAIIPATDIKICQPCSIQLENALAFMDLCQKSHHILKETYFGYGTGYDDVENYGDPVDDTPPLHQYNMGVLTNYSGLGNINATESILPDNSNTYEEEQQTYDESILVESTDDDDDDEREQPSNSADQSQQGFPCSECGMVQWTPKELVNHWRIHSNSADESSDNDQQDLLVDMTVEKPEKKNKHKCFECKRQFNHVSGRKSLLRHIRTVHSKQKKRVSMMMRKQPYVRPITTTLTADPAKEYLFNCDQCPAKYTSIGSLRSHARKHTGLYSNFDCTICKKSFQSQSGRTLHVQKHHMNLMHECRICDQKFSYVMGLWRHSFDHSGTHPFNCTICEFKTKVKPAFREHLEKEHGITYREEIHGCKDSTKKILDNIRKPRNGVIMNYC